MCFSTLACGVSQHVQNFINENRRYKIADYKTMLNIKLIEILINYEAYPYSWPRTVSISLDDLLEETG